MEFTITINGIEYSVPNVFTVEQWMKLSKWQLKETQDWPYIMSAAIGAPIQDLIELQKNDEMHFAFMVSIVFSALGAIGDTVLQQIDEYKLMALEQMTIGEFIDMDIYAIDPKNFDKMVAKLYAMPVERVKTLRIDQAMPAVQYYLNWRRAIYSNYKALFDYNEDAESAPGDKQLSPAHAWYETIMILCDGRFKDIQYIVSRPFREAFNYLAWKKTKTAEEKMQLQKLEMKYKKR